MRTVRLLAPVALCGLMSLLAACVVTVGGSCSTWESIEGSGVEASETREVAPFSRIEVSGSARLVATVGAAQSLRVSCDDNLLPFVRTEVRGDTLHIGMQSGSYSFRRHLVVELTVPRLEGLGINGSADATLAGLSGELFEISISGSGDVRADGSVGGLKVAISGSGDVDLSKLRARTADVSISGSGDAVVDVSDELDVQISGSGDVRYTGSPRVRSSTSGSGSVNGS